MSEEKVRVEIKADWNDGDYVVETNQMDKDYYDDSFRPIAKKVMASPNNGDVTGSYEGLAERLDISKYDADEFLQWCPCAPDPQDIHTIDKIEVMTIPTIIETFR